MFVISSQIESPTKSGSGHVLFSDMLLCAGCANVKCIFYKLCLVLLQVPKCFGLVQIFCARPKIYLHIVAVTNDLCQTKRWFAFRKIGFCAGTKVFEEALNAVKFFRLAQKIWTSTKHFGTCKRTKHMPLLPFWYLRAWQNWLSSAVWTQNFGSALSSKEHTLYLSFLGPNKPTLIFT